MSAASSLVRAAIEGGLLVLAIAIVARAFPRLPAATRTALWWLASLRLVAGLVALPALALRMPALPEAPHGFARATLTAAQQLSPTGAALAPITELARSAESSKRMRGFTWSDIARLAGPLARAATPYLLALWACGVLTVLALHILAARRLQRLWRGAEPFEHPEMREWLTTWLGARAAARVRVRTTPDAASPVLLAGHDSRILLPATCAALEPASLRMVLAHETAHIRRHDLALGALPALAHALFWFHPLAHWAVDEYAQSREEACDADAVRACDAPPHHYGELLLAYGIDQRRDRCAAVSYGSRRASQLHRRLLMLAHGIRPTSSQRLLGLAALVVIGLVAMRPVRLVAATPTGQTAVDESHESGSSYSYSHSTSSHAGDRESFSYGYGKSVGNGELNVSGSFETNEIRWIRSLGKSSPEGFGWFRLDGRNFVVTERAAVARIREIMEPQNELGRRQGELGERQGELGKKQGELGERQGELGSRQGELSARIAKLEAELAGARLSEARQLAVRDRITALENAMQDLEAEQEDLSQQQEELGAQQDQLGAQQDELGKQQDALSERVDAEMHELAAELVRTGQAVPVERR